VLEERKRRCSPFEICKDFYFSSDILTYACFAGSEDEILKTVRQTRN
jgi:hypothetical protein